MTQDAGTFLTRILEHKYTEVARQQTKIPVEQLQERIKQAPLVRDFAAALRNPNRATLIAEVKKASPSRGVLVEHFEPLALARTYAEAGASAISILTDVRFFQGSLKFLEGIRQLDLPTPLLRKDFIVDPYQIYEARAYGADALLLIVAALDDQTLASLHTLTYELGMQALVEVHNQAELSRAMAIGAQIIGVNNRDLHTFHTSLATTELVAAALPTKDRPVLVSESGIFNHTHVTQVRAAGADAILVGEALVTATDITGLVHELIDPR